MILLFKKLPRGKMKKKYINKQLSLTLCSLLLTGTSLLANDTDKEENKLDSITVVEKSSSNYLNYENPTTMRGNLTLEETPKSIQVFNEAFIQDYQAQNINDIILMSSSLVYLGDNHGRGNTFAIRGFSGIPILRDGLSFTNSIIAYPEVYNLTAVEVLKGPDSLQFGESSPGGLVNLVKKKPLKEDHAQIELEITSNSSYSPKVDVGGSINEDGSLRYRLVSVAKYDEGFLNTDVDTDRVFISPSLAYDINNENTITFVAEYLDETTPSSFGTFVNSNGDLVTDRENIVSNPDEEFHKTQKLIGFDLDSTFDTWSSNFKYRYVDYIGDNGDVHMPQSYTEATDTIRRVYAYQKQEMQEHALQYTLNKEIDIFDLKNRISVGADYNKAYSKLDMYYDPFTAYNLDASNPYYESLTNLSDHPTAMDFSGNRSYTKRWGIFLQDNIDLSDKLIFSAGVRYSESKPQDDQKSDATTPSFGLTYKLSPQTSIYTNYSESFTPNTNVDINGDILEPEVGEGMELGIKQKLFNDTLDLTAAIFKIEKENVAIATSIPSIFEASGKQESKGFEMDLSGELLPGLCAIASYGYTRTKDKDNDDQEFTGVPKHTANIFMTYDISSWGLKDMYIGGGARYIGERYTGSRIELDSEIIYNATFGYKNNNWRFGLSIQNLTDEIYSEAANGERVQVGTPRTVLATLSYTF
jgi:iron complex outermembrane recepter protein